MEIFSPNMLKTFEECQKKFEYKYIQKISAPQKITPFEKGKKIHALANYYLRNQDISKLENTLNNEERLLWEKLKENEYLKKIFVQSEYNLSFKISDYWVGGRIDAIVKDDEQYYILDYKTGSIPQNPEYDYQTMIYLLATYKYFNKKCSFVYINLKQDTNYKIDLTSELINKYETRIIKICDLISQTDSYQTSKNCDFCEYNTFCQQ